MIVDPSWEWLAALGKWMRGHPFATATFHLLNGTFLALWGIHTDSFMAFWPGALIICGSVFMVLHHLWEQFKEKSKE